MDIRQLTKAELEASLRLSEFAFQYELSEAERPNRIERTNPEQIWGCFVDGALASKMTILPLEVWIHGQRFAMGGIAGVATWPEYRRQGMVEALIQNALTVMRQNGQFVSMLHPFSFEFYRRYGWETIVDQLHYEIDIDRLPRISKQTGIVAATDDVKQLKPIYDEYASRYNGMLGRDGAWWEWNIMTLKKARTCIYTDDQGNGRGYIRYQVSQSEMTIHEFVHLDEQARLAMWRFISNHDSMIRSIKLTAPATDRLNLWLPNPRIKQELKPYFMGRIVDVEQFLAGYKFRTEADQSKLGQSSFVLRIQDRYASWNDGVFQVTACGGGTAKVERIREPQDEEMILTCGIHTLSTILLGYSTAQEQHTLGNLLGKSGAIEIFGSHIPRCPTYLSDFF